VHDGVLHVRLAEKMKPVNSPACVRSHGAQRMFVIGTLQPDSLLEHENDRRAWLVAKQNHISFKFIATAILVSFY
jgi:hypothetical protein